MNPERSLFLLSFLALLVLGLSQQSLAETLEEKFKRQHVDSGNKGNPGKKYCNQMMSKRGMTKVKCKPVNTFVHESYKEIQNICHEANTQCANQNMHNCHKSKHPLSITKCSILGGSKPGKCKYRVKSAKKQITVACGGRPLKPIHLE
ncbi:ribonuclease pancreatic A-like [Macrotis lagotis]|uniref:ribonuclease pancreatic A-like n=1 Tax=Macrotis lagotis TaxID=92651 RepID=UPI003D69CFAB